MSSGCLGIQDMGSVTSANIPLCPGRIPGSTGNTGTFACPSSALDSGSLFGDGIGVGSTLVGSTSMVGSIWADSGLYEAPAPSLVARKCESPCESTEIANSARSLHLVCNYALASGGGGGGGGGGIVTSCLIGGVGSGAEVRGGTLAGRCGARRFPASTYAGLGLKEQGQFRILPFRSSSESLGCALRKCLIISPLLLDLKWPASTGHS